MIEFFKRKTQSKIMDPRNDFSANEIEVEFRRDPLTEESSRIAHIGLISPQREDYSSWDQPDLKERCPFCPSNIEQATPRFPAEILPEGQLQKGEARVIANIGPYDQVSALTVMGKEHLMPLENMSFSYLKDAFAVSIDFSRAVLQNVEDLVYPMLAWNYMPPSGGGLLHPHQQIFVSEYPGNLHRRMMKESEKFYQNWGRNFWQELCIKEEQENERFIGKKQQSCWLTSFAPRGVLGEVLAVFPELSTVYDINDSVLDDLVTGLLELFKYFSYKNIGSFNLAMFTVPSGEREKYFSLHVRIIPRTFLNLQTYPPDMNSMQVALQEPFSVISPEEQCKEIQAYFNT